MKELLYQYNPWEEESFKNENVKPREKYLVELRKVHKIKIEEKIYASDLGSYFENYIYLLLRNKKTLFYLYENTTEVDFFTEDKILIESTFYAELNKKQKKLFNEYPANKKLVIDSVEKLEVLNEIQKETLEVTSLL